ncbi:hypothetical protein PENSPDRAFT_748866 [Peniophora sp. CONT]|nr:hypothetical protein PENSPDRAFT_748866 [Peniophora sp. CONT]
MALSDIFSLFLTITIFVGTIVGVVIAFQKISSAIENTKAQLKDKGWNISESGVSVKTDKRMVTQEDQVDAAQRGMFKAMNAASFRKGAGGDVRTGSDSPQLGVPQSTRSLSRSSSRSSIGGESVEETKRRHRFRRNKDSVTS